MSKAPLEIEYKFLIKFPDVPLLAELPDYKAQQFLQIYTRLPDGRKCRIRKATLGENISYIKTFKEDVTPLTRVEIEEEISKEEFEELVFLRIPDRKAIEKVRHSFSLSGFTYEVDIFPFWDDRALLEIEVESENIIPPIPDFLTVIRDVTEDRRYRNSALSKQVVYDTIN